MRSWCGNLRTRQQERRRRNEGCQTTRSGCTEAPPTVRREFLNRARDTIRRVPAESTRDESVVHVKQEKRRHVDVNWDDVAMVEVHPLLAN